MWPFTPHADGVEMKTFGAIVQVGVVIAALVKRLAVLNIWVDTIWFSRTVKSSCGRTSMNSGHDGQKYKCG